MVQGLNPAAAKPESLNLIPSDYHGGRTEPTPTAGQLTSHTCHSMYAPMHMHTHVHMNTYIHILYIHTYIHTQTGRQTNRQTDRSPN